MNLPKEKRWRRFFESLNRRVICPVDYPLRGSSSRLDQAAHLVQLVTYAPVSYRVIHACFDAVGLFFIWRRSQTTSRLSVLGPRVLLQRIDPMIKTGKVMGMYSKPIPRVDRM